MENVTNSSRREMLKKVQEADFTALEWQLYLNTHPYCEKGLRLYLKAVQEAKCLEKNTRKTTDRSLQHLRLTNFRGSGQKIPGHGKKKGAKLCGSMKRNFNIL